MICFSVLSVSSVVKKGIFWVVGIARFSVLEAGSLPVVRAKIGECTLDSIFGIFSDMTKFSFKIIA